MKSVNIPQQRRVSPANASVGSGEKATRRRFVCACAACAACGAMPLLKGINLWAAERTRKPRIRLVFAETPNNKPIWPNIGYDFDARRRQVTDLLTKSLPDLEFLSVRLMDNPTQSEELLAQDAEVDGYLVCVQGLGWNNNILKLCTNGKPTLLVDNLFGGSGLFLRDIGRIMNSGKPVNWVSSASDQDLVRSAQHFTGLAQSRTGAEIAAAFGATRRKNTPPVMDWSCEVDPVGTVNLDQALQQLQQTRLLVVGGGWGGDEFRKASKEVTGVEFLPITFEELAAAYAQADPKAAKVYAEQWTSRALTTSDVRPEDIEKSGVMYVAMRRLLNKHGARGISIDCLGGFYGGHLKAYPCLGFCQLNDDGFVGGCEADQMSALTMAIMGVLADRPGFISDPVIDTSRNVIIYTHCVAMTKPFGRQGKANPYEILTHSEDRRGASMRSLLPAGYLTTTLEINPTNRQVLIHQARTVGHNCSDMACRTKLEAVVKGDLEKLVEHWSMGWHRVTFYGDLKRQVEQLCQRLKLQLIEEA